MKQENTQPELKAVKTAEETKQYLQDEYDQAIKRNGQEYADYYIEGLKDGIEYANQFSQPKEGEVEKCNSNCPCDNPELKRSGKCIN